MEQETWRDNFAMLVLILLTVVGSAIALWLSARPATDQTGASIMAMWGAALIALVSFIGLLRKITEILVAPEIRVKRVLAYGVLMASALVLLARLLGVL